MSDDVLIIPLSDSDRWRSELAADGRPSQAWDYLQAISREGAEPQLAVVHAGGARLVIPFIERDWTGNTDIATPLGLSGASINPGSSVPLAVWRDYAISQGWVAGYIQLAEDTELEPSHRLDRVVVGNEIFLLDLKIANPMASASEIVRRKLRRAKLSGVEAVLDSTALADALVRLYPETMDRLGAGSVYLHGEASLRKLAALEGAVVIGAAQGGVVQSVSVFLRTGHRAEYLCNACSAQGRELAAWLIAGAIGMLQAAGATELNLGGGVVAGDGLHQFKARFNGRLSRLQSLRQVYDEDRYLALCEAAGEDRDGDWFPAYRRPGASKG